MSTRHRARRIFFLIVVTLLPFVPALLRHEVFTLRDHADYFIPLRYFTAQVLRSGELPLWNPYNGGGEPWLANPQTAVFYPPAWLFLLLPFATAYVLFLALHVSLLAVGCFLLFRTWSSPPAAFFGAVSASLAGSTLSLLDIGNNLASLAWLPWILIAALWEERWRILVAPLLLALAFLAGEPLLALIAAAAYTLLSLARRGQHAIGDVVSTAALSISLGAVQLLPFLESLRGTDRVSGLDPSLAFSQTASLRDWAAASVAPWAFSPNGWLTLSQSFIPSVYAGIGAVVMAAMACGALHRLERPTRNAALALLVLLLCAILFSTSPRWHVARELLLALHVNVSRYPSRVLPLGVIALAGLSAIGIDAVRRVSTPARLTATAVVLVLFGTYAASGAIPSGGKILPIIGFANLALWVCIVAAAPHLSSRAVGVIATAALTLDLYAAARPLLKSAKLIGPGAPWAGSIPADRRFARLPPRGPDFDRFLWMAGYRNLIDSKFDLSSPAPATPREYLKLHDAALYGPRLDLLRFLSVSSLVTDRNLPLPEIAHAGGVSVRALGGAEPFARTWTRFETVESADAALRRVLERRSIAVPVISGRSLPVPALTESESFVRILKLGVRDALLEVRTGVPAVLTLNQLVSPGWRVTVDGRDANEMRANGVFRAVLIDAGTHRVLWKYSPRSLQVGAVVSTIAMLFLLTRAFIFLREKNRKILLASE